MRPGSHAIGIWWIVVALVVSSSPAFAASVTAGAWQLDSDLNASAARDVLSQLTFSPKLDAGDNAWLVSSSAYQFSDGAGDIGPSAVLAPTCQTASASCATFSDIYSSSGGRLVHVGRLRFHSNNLFDAPATQASAFNYPNNAHSNQSALPSGSDIPLTLPQEWLWMIAAGIVLVLTLAFILRNRD